MFRRFSDGVATTREDHRLQGSRRRTTFSEHWRRADHNFAVATIALMIFFLVAGFAAWILNEKPSVTKVNAAPAHGSEYRSTP
jgi:hypothetical protein